MVIAGRHMTLQEQIAAFVLAPVYAHLMPVQPVLISLGILIAVDTVLGMWASFKRGRAIVSGRFWRVFQKTAVMILVVVGMQAYENLSKGMIPAVTLVSTAIAIAEALSILENAQVILGQPLFKFLMKKLDSKNIHKPKGE